MLKFFIIMTIIYLRLKKILCAKEVLSKRQLQKAKRRQSGYQGSRPAVKGIPEPKNPDDRGKEPPANHEHGGLIKWLLLM
jgi:hypothetical protein